MRLPRLNLWKGIEVTQTEATAVEDFQWEDREASFKDAWKPEKVGDSIMGVVLRLTQERTSHGPSTLLHLRTDEGPVPVWISGGLKGYLDVFMEANVLVKITYTGEEDTGKGNPMKTFRVQTARK